MFGNRSNQPSQDAEFRRHWSDRSERYAGCDALLTALHNQWEAEGTCYEERYYHAGTRLVTIYHFILHKGDETLQMPVIANPVLRRILREWPFTVVPLEMRQQEHSDIQR